jgi:hypothetical protein
MRLLPRHGHVHFASTRGPTAAPSIDMIEAGDRVYLNCGGRLVPITLLERNDRHCIGRVASEITDTAHRGEMVEFDVDDIYVVQRLHDSQ